VHHRYLPHQPLLSALSRAPLRAAAYFRARRGPPDGYCEPQASDDSGLASAASCCARGSHRRSSKRQLLVTAPIRPEDRNWVTKLTRRFADRNGRYPIEVFKSRRSGLSPISDKIQLPEFGYLFAVCSIQIYLSPMTDNPEIDHLKREIERLDAENCALRAADFRTSKAEAMLAFEYDRIPTVLKTPNAIRTQRKFATALLFVIPAMLALVAIVGGINAYRDHIRSAEFEKADAKLNADFQRDRDHH